MGLQKVVGVLIMILLRLRSLTWFHVGDGEPKTRVLHPKGTPSRISDSQRCPQELPPVATRRVHAKAVRVICGLQVELAKLLHPN